MNPVRIARKVARAAFAADPVSRYESRHSLVNELAARWGLKLYGPHLAWLSDEPFRRAWDACPAQDQRASDRRFIVHSFARSVADLAGDTAECGTLFGASSYLICDATARPGREHHIFDSFHGLSDPGSADVPQTETSYKWSKHDLSVPLDVVKRNLAKFPSVRYHEGWIPTRFEDVADRRFAFVHVDVDLYEPTRDSLEFFYPRLVTGGVLLCDDYGHLPCPGATKAFDDLVRDKPEARVVHLTTGQGFIIKR